MSYRHEADVAIIGCGPAGISAAIQLTRSGVDCLVFERARVGGLLLNANLVENYPGFPEGIAGAELAHLMEKHLTAHSVDVISLEVSRLDLGQGGFIINTAQGAFRSRITIVATGTRPKAPENVRTHSSALPRVLYEIVPIMGVHDKEIVIVGAGDAAFDYALNLGRLNRVTILNRTDRTKCLRILRERAEALGSIRYLESTTLIEVTALSEKRASVLCRWKGEDFSLPVDFVVFAIGREPELGFLAKPLSEETERLCEEGLLHLVGDVTRGAKRQTAIAVGDGVRAAMEVYAKLRVQAR